MKDFKRITLLCGHYGSGKTNVAVNMALMLKKQRDNVAIADLDIVNPYFRTKDSSEEFEQNGIRLIASDFANSNVDIPALPQDMYAITDDKDMSVIIDVGGDDRGALALGRLAPAIMEEDNYEMLMVVNCFRPLTRDAESTLEVMREIEYASHMKFTGIVNNSNLGVATTPDDVISSTAYANEVAQLCSLPVVCTTVEKNIYNDLCDKIDNLLPLSLQVRPV